MLSSLRRYLRIKRQSLIFRLLLYFVISMVIVAIILSISFTSRIKPHLKNDLLPNLARYIEYVVDDIGSPPDLEKARSLAFELPFEIRIEGPGTDWSSQSNIQSISAHELERATPPYQKYYIGAEHDSFFVMVDKRGFSYLFVVDSDFRTGSRKRHWILFMLLGGTLFGLYAVIRRMFRPIARISQQVSKIGAGELDAAIELRGEDELAQLARGIDRMSQQIKNMLESKAGLLLAISHELRSPITRMRVNLELLDDSDTRKSLIEDVREMEALVSTIVESERLNTNHAPLNRVKLDMAETINEVLKDYFAEDGIRQEMVPVVGYFDQLRVQLLVKNLLDNACRYSIGSDIPVEIKLQRQADYLIMEVIDHGPGIDASDLEHITEPFYRADTARQRSTGGYGLGLYLCKLIVEAHAGAIEIQSSPGQGTRVIVRLPISVDRVK
ncbi:MAG: HAMP domain-containing sensor histidine kinase [Gammaproteobacteria bacterium]|nr:HAMP domain-containing sensor histidine kinase [Gammaproteobacteria bacterium]